MGQAICDICTYVNVPIQTTHVVTHMYVYRMIKTTPKQAVVVKLTDSGHCLFLLRLLKEQKKTERALTESQESAFWHVWKPPVRAYAPCAVLKCAMYVCMYVYSFQHACNRKGMPSTSRHSASLSLSAQPSHGSG